MAGGRRVGWTGAGGLGVSVPGADDAEWHRWWDRAAWSPWVSLGGVPAGNTIGDVPYYRQVYELSCEEASLQMALAHQGIGVSQGQELNEMGIDWRRAYSSGG